MGNENSSPKEGRKGDEKKSSPFKSVPHSAYCRCSDCEAANRNQHHAASNYQSNEPMTFQTLNTAETAREKAPICIYSKKIKATCDCPYCGNPRRFPETSEGIVKVAPHLQKRSVSRERSVSQQRQVSREHSASRERSISQQRQVFRFPGFSKEGPIAQKAPAPPIPTLATTQIYPKLKKEDDEICPHSGTLASTCICSKCLCKEFDTIPFPRSENPKAPEERKQPFESRSGNLSETIRKNVAVPEWMQKFLLDHGELKQMLNQVSKIVICPNGKNVILDGEAEAVTRVEELMSKLIVEIPTQYTIRDLDVNPKYYKFIIGKDGNIVKKIREDTNTEIEVPGKQSKIFMIKIIGKSPDVGKAERIINEIIENSEEKLKREQNNLIRTVCINKVFHKILIGNKGYDIKLLSKATGAFIHFPKGMEDSDEVIINGIEEAIKKAKEALRNAVKAIAEQKGYEFNEKEFDPEPETEINDMYEIILKQLRCHICSKMMRSPIFMCTNAHNVCSNCKSAGTLCVCNGKIEEKRNLYLQNLTYKVTVPCEFKINGCDFKAKLSEIADHESDCYYAPKLFCKYSTNGCPFKNAQQIKIAQHEADCAFVPRVPCQFQSEGCNFQDKPVYVNLHQETCPFVINVCPLKAAVKCDWKGSYAGLKNHAREKHGHFLTAARNRAVLEQDLSRKGQILVSMYEELFKVACHTNGETHPMSVTVTCLNPLKKDVEYLFELEFVDQTGKGMLFIIRQFCSPFKTASEKTLHIPKNLLKAYVTNKQVFFKITIVSI